MDLNESYWSERYQSNQTGWDIGYASPAIVNYVANNYSPTTKILIPGCGNAHEAAYLWDKGFRSVYLLDISQEPLNNFAEKHPSFPKDHLICEDFFKFEDTFDLILEQTFFCALHPDLRLSYVTKMHELLSKSGVLCGLLFNIPLYADHPPFGGDKEEYTTLFKSNFEILKMEEAKGSIPQRDGNELFFICNPI